MVNGGSYISWLKAFFKDNRQFETEKWNSYIAKIRDENRRRPALIDEFRRL